MAEYKVRFFNHGNHTVGSVSFNADTDANAQHYAAQVLRSPFGRGHEIWEAERLVHREVYEK